MIREEIVVAKGTEVYACGSMKILRYRNRFFTRMRPQRIFGGPYKTPGEALDNTPMTFGPGKVNIRVSGIPPVAVANRITLNAPEGHTIKINGELWELVEGVLTNRGTS